MNQAVYYINDTNSVPENVVKLPVTKIINKITLLASLAKACDFPNYFAYNWDSAWDCLTDSSVNALLLDLSEASMIDRKDLMAFIYLLEDAYEVYARPYLWIKNFPENQNKNAT